MTPTIQVGSCDNNLLPYQSLGKIFFDNLQNHENRVIMIDTTTSEEVTYEKFSKLCIKLATELKKLGVKKGDVITIISQNNWKCLLTIIAGFYVGASVNLLNHDYTSGELKYLLGICQPTLIFCTTETSHKISSFKNILVYDSKSFNDLLEGNIDGNFKPVELDPKEDVALILTSSGTTGLPKCVMLTHANFRISMICAGDPLSLDLNSKETTIAYLPFFHIVGTTVVLGSILHGTKFVILDKFVPDLFLKTIQDYKISKLFAVPPVLQFLIKNPVVNNYDVSSIRDIISGAAPLDKELEDLIQEKFKIKVRQGYGQTEAAGACTIIRKNEEKAGSVGRVNIMFKIKICDTETGNLLPPYQIGELRVSGDAVMKGYLGNDEESKNAFDEDGFLKSGDLGYYDEDGYFFIVDRLKEVIKYKGFQVSPVELESLLLRHPAVKDVGIVGVPDERAGEVPLAFIVKQPNYNLTEKEIIEYVENNISVQKRLYGGVRFIEEIPRSASGKMLRKKLKELL